MKHKANEQHELLIEIARCPLVELNVSNDRATHPCSKVVLHQWPNAPRVDARAKRWRREHHIPEPWVGHIEKAPLLFVSSNPSLASFRPAKAPTAFAPPLDRIGNHARRDHPALRHGLAAAKPDWTDDDIVDRYENGFEVWTVGGTHAVENEEGEAGQRISYWADVHPLAVELLGGNAVAGEHYALTEVTHCKSQQEIGARSASLVCAPLYLERVIALSPARVIVVFGGIARNAVRRAFDYPDPGRVSRPLRIAGPHSTSCVSFAPKRAARPARISEAPRSRRTERGSTLPTPTLDRGRTAIAAHHAPHPASASAELFPTASPIFSWCALTIKERQ